MEYINNNTTVTECDSNNVYTASIAFFAVGAALFLGTLIFWSVHLCKARHRRIKAITRPLPLTPPTRITTEMQASGEYLDLQESINKYDSINISPNANQTENVRYIPRDAMHETFDGSRMPPTEAPKPPNLQPEINNEKEDKREELEHTYEMAESKKPDRDRPPTIPARRHKKN